MNDIEPRKEIMPTNVLAKQGVSAVAYLAGGILLFILAVGSRGILGFILPIAALIIGIGALLSKDQEDKKPGLIVAAAGILGVLLRFGPGLVKVIAGTLLGVGAIGLLAAGIFKGIKFLTGLKSRQ